MTGYRFDIDTIATDNPFALTVLLCSWLCFISGAKLHPHVCAQCNCASSKQDPQVNICAQAGYK